MKIIAKSVCSMSMPYAVATVDFDEKKQIIAATEDHGKTIVAAPPEWKAREIIAGPGGCMSIAQPENSRDIYAIYGCFLGYQFHQGAVYRLRRREEQVGQEGSPCTIEKVFALPFAHRICFAYRNGVEYLVAANLAATKSGADDWSQPGAAYAGPIPGLRDVEWGPRPIVENLHKNHCMFSGTLNGRRMLMIGGREGLFGLDLDTPGSDWHAHQILTQEISEVVTADLDNDGFDELVTIEPFHGNRLVVYHVERGGWKNVLELELEYGHGLWSGKIAGRTALVVGNRSGSANLEILLPKNGSQLELERHAVAEGAGSANTAVVDHDGVSWIVAANQTSSEVVAYRVDSL